MRGSAGQRAFALFRPSMISRIVCIERSTDAISSAHCFNSPLIIAACPISLFIFQLVFQARPEIHGDRPELISHISSRRFSGHSSKDQMDPAIPVWLSDMKCSPFFDQFIVFLTFQPFSTRNTSSAKEQMTRTPTASWTSQCRLQCLRQRFPL